MRYQPKSAADVAMIIPAGEYEFTVEAAMEKVSKTGNDMIQLSLRVYGPKEILVTDYLLSSESGAWKLRSFAEAVGILDLYEAGNMTDAECRDRSGRVKLKVDEGDDEYPPKNAVKGYVKRKAEKAAKAPDAKPELVGVSREQQARAAKAAPDSDIPF